MNLERFSIKSLLQYGAAGVLALAFIVPYFVMLMTTFFLTARQIIIWIHEARWVEADLYFLIAESKCAATGFRPMGWTGKEMCRSADPNFTSLKGLNQLLDWFFELHLVFASAIGTAIWLTGTILIVLLLSELLNVKTS